ncbi:YhgE/Pip domain-containing protein [Bacillus piscicola]|uniref:YhgE/Pip domain-containing protein n=1 Tax=Bacillus piscicola TaxID=1632684 RepID=UPI001F099300|nr:YhgE/Pip domain-containing protein [Bacillus piscicola]
MKQSWSIYRHDLKNTTTNWVALIIIGGLIVLPSLYAWFNIKASWDPYGQTDRIPVGIVNEDEGATIRDHDMNVGKELVETLKENDSLNWQFTDRKTAMDKLEYGDYFAVIVVPEDFSEKMATVMSDHPEKSTIDYYVNEKINAIAPKITEKGASVIVQKVSGQFISTVNGVIFDVFNKLGIEIESQLPDIEAFETYIFQAEEQLPDVYQLLQDGLDEASTAQGIIEKAQARLPDAKNATEEGLQTIHDTEALLAKAENKLDELAPKIEADLKKAQQTASTVHDFLTDLTNTDISFEKQEELMNKLDARVTESVTRLSKVEQALERLSELNTDNPDASAPNRRQEAAQAVLDKAAADVATLRGALEEMQSNAGTIDQFITDKHGEVDQVLANLTELSANTDTRIGQFLEEYHQDIEPAVRKKMNTAKTTLATGSDVLTDIQSTIPEVAQVLENADTTLSDGEEMLQKIANEYPYIRTKINELANRIRDIQGKTDIHEIIELLKNDPDAERSFFEEPVKLNKNELFPIANYGSGMTPFYTVLAIWVGGLLLISLLATDVHDPSPYTVSERYFGKLFTFLTIGLLQTLIVTSGDLFLLHVEVREPVWFILFGLLISLVFVTIIYTVVTIFGDVGKAAVIVMLVLQIAGAGGTYPVILLPEFFQAISPFLPFTYAIDLMREALGGIVWERAQRDMLFLALFGLAFLVIGTWLKKPINKQTEKLVKKSRQSGMFH